ncbi:MAG: glycyl-radical enzyme activating protein [Candidatus Lokiarchaeota archaeon]|nr:glycyl-radical enzyme activating protein [Candidatus Lokiarchaeota archaeon]
MIEEKIEDECQNTLENTEIDQKLDSGNVFNIQRFSINDGPGIRTTVFLKGCFLRCPWCSNPESIKSESEIILRTVKCIKCGRCQETCPQNAVNVTEDITFIDYEKCTLCMQCVEGCPPRAIEKIGDIMSSDEVLDTVMKDINYYNKTDGGITLSGGEPLKQWKFSVDLLKKAKQKGLHTTIDTTGYSDWNILSKLLQYTDLLLYDIKHVNEKAHLNATGKSNSKIINNLKKILSETDVRVWIRVPMIPGFNNSKNFITALSSFILNLPKQPEKVWLLPFHKYATNKYIALGRIYKYSKVELIDENVLNDYINILKSNGISAEIEK